MQWKEKEKNADPLPQRLQCSAPVGRSKQTEDIGMETEEAK